MKRLFSPIVRQHTALLLLMVAISVVVLGGCSKKEAGPTQDIAADGQTPAAVAATPAAAVSAVKLLADHDALYRVSAAELRAAGFDPAAHAVERLQLTLNGEPVALAVQGSGDSLVLTFYGQARNSRFGTANVYRLGWGDAPGARLADVAVAAPEANQTETTYFMAEGFSDENSTYLSQTPADSDHWVGASIFAPAAYTMTFDLPGQVEGPVTLALTVWANTEDLTVEPDHHLMLTLNGAAVADERWDGKGWHTITATVAADLALPAHNTLTLHAPGDTTAAVDVLYPNRLSWHYPRALDASGGQVQFAMPADQAVAVQVAGDDALVWDITAPAAAQRLEGMTAQAGVLRFQTPAEGGQRRYLVADPAAVAAVQIEPWPEVDLRLNPEGADYIAIVYPAFRQTLQPLIDYRRSQGLRVTVADIGDVYNTFSGGMMDPAAIRNYMRYARQNWPAPAPRFLLLVGDASYDYQGFLSGSGSNFVPTYLLQTHFVGETASDNWFVNLDDADDRPDMAVGRIPAQTPQQVADVVAKTLAYEQSNATQPWAGRALFVADDKQDSFQQISDDLAGLLPAAYQVEKVYLGQNDAPNAAVISDLNNGVGLLSYVGHGSMNVWAQEKMLSIEDAAKLDNQVTPVMLTMTCLVGYFHHPSVSSMAEVLLFNPQGGIVAGFVPTSESLATDQSELAAAIYSHLFNDAPTVGEAIMLGKQDLSAERDLMQDLIETFTLLGDPALRLQRPS
ncbi:MAG: C25 family cysteine peptidase [Caldilineales bacterium]